MTDVTVIPEQSMFELEQRKAVALSKSTLIPKDYQNNLPNCLIAMEVASRTNSSVMMVMQNLYIVHGRPSWSSQYIIAAINACGRFKPLRFKMEGEGMKRACTAWTTDSSGEVLEGPQVTMEMAKAEQWLDKNGSKWKTMPELMLRYRAAAFFGRLYAPDILMGMQTDQEIIDITPPIEPDEGAMSEPEQPEMTDDKAAMLFDELEVGLTACADAAAIDAYLGENSAGIISLGKSGRDWAVKWAAAVTKQRGKVGA